MGATPYHIKALASGYIRAAQGAGTTTLTNDDQRGQSFSLSAGHTCVMATTGVKAGDLWVLENDSLVNKLTVQASGGQEISIANGANLGASIHSGWVVLRALQDAPTLAAHWKVVDRRTEATISAITFTTITANFDSTPSFVSGTVEVIDGMAFGRIAVSIDTTDAAAYAFSMPDSSLPYAARIETRLLNGLGNRNGSQASVAMYGEIRGVTGGLIYFVGQSNTANGGTWYFTFTYPAA